MDLKYALISIESKTAKSVGHVYSETLAMDTELNVGFEITAEETEEDAREIDVVKVLVSIDNQDVNIYDILSGDMIEKLEDEINRHLFALAAIRTCEIDSAARSSMES